MRRTLQRLCLVQAACVLAGLSSAAQAAPEKETWLGLPVEFAQQEYAFRSGLAIELSKVKVQTTAPIEVGKVWVKPDWADWITEFRTTRLRAETGVVVARPSSLSRLGVVDGPSTHKITRLDFSGLNLLFGTLSLELPAGEMRFAPDGSLSVIRIPLEATVNLELSPLPGGKLGVLLQSGSLKWPVLPAFIFDSVAAQGEMGDDYASLEKIGANGDGGAVSGSMRLVAAEKWLLEGEMEMQGVRGRDVLSRLYPRATVDGFLAGTFKFESAAGTFAELASSVTVTGTYSLKNGSIDRFGLLEGMRRSGPGIVGGGLVRFERLGGKFSGRTGEPAQAEFQGLSSGALRGSSSFTVQQDGRLKGSVFGSLTLPGGENVSRNFVLAGKVDAPSLSVR